MTQFLIGISQAGLQIFGEVWTGSGARRDRQFRNFLHILYANLVAFNLLSANTLLVQLPQLRRTFNNVPVNAVVSRRSHFSVTSRSILPLASYRRKLIYRNAPRAFNFVLEVIQENNGKYIFIHTQRV